ncbi:MAG: SGNH/GDSL hydrolase family protein [Desulfocapsaceae bacterium]|nr:SGNH/GDSL hydrolase family protein [Desulfocapsaceae bacterium]
MKKLFNKTVISHVFIFCLILICVLLFPDKGFTSEALSIIAYGDSLTEGCDVSGYTVCAGWLGGYNYTNNLKALLLENGHSDITVYNHGKGGETTWESVNRMSYLFALDCNNQTGYILIMHGTNDLFFGIQMENIKFNLGVMIDKSRAKGLIPLLATIPPDPDHEWKDIPLMNDYIRQLAQEKDVILVDQYNFLAPDWDIYTNPQGCYNDRLHPNRSGFDAIGYLWYENLSELLPKKHILPGLMLLLHSAH